MRIRWAMVHCGGMGSPNIYNTREADVSKSPTCQSAFAGNSSAGKASAVLPFTHFSRVLNPLIFVRNFGVKRHQLGSGGEHPIPEEAVMTNPLSFDELQTIFHQGIAHLPDYRKDSPNTRYTMQDAALGAFGIFFTQSPSFLGAPCSR